MEDSYDDIASSQKSGKQADPKDEGILIATTRPELMAACVAVVMQMKRLILNSVQVQ